MKKILKTLKSNLQQIDAIHRQKAIDEWEVRELKHIFALTTMGMFVGMPSAPLSVTMELLPDMQQEFAILISKIDTAHSPLSDYFSRLDVS